MIFTGSHGIKKEHEIYGAIKEKHFFLDLALFEYQLFQCNGRVQALKVCNN